MPRLEVTLTSFAVIVLLAAPIHLMAQGLPTATPEEVGMSSEKLQDVTALMQRHVDFNAIAGAVTLVARHGKVVHYEAVGQRDMEAGAPMTTDTVFRIASMTKPITAIAAMTLYDEGHFELDDPISKWLPEFEKMQVALEDEDGKSRLVPARPITVRHILTHTSGLAANRGRSRARLRDAAPSARQRTLEDYVRRLATLPLDFQPGELWVYGSATNVVGRLVEVLSGLTLDEFFQERIFKPLGVRDTHFYLPVDKLDRFAALYEPGDFGAIRLREAPTRQSASVREPHVFFSGAGGLVSTAADYVRTQQMMLNGGELDGARLLRPETVELMIENHVGDIEVDGAPGWGFGLGYRIATDNSLTQFPGSIGTYSWGGTFYTIFLVDPKKDLIAIMLTQVAPNRHLRLSEDFQIGVYEAIIDDEP